MNMDRDLTPKERADEALLRQLLAGDGGCCEIGKQATQGPPPAAAEMSRVQAGSFGVMGTVAALYLPLQPFEEVYDEATALARGTLFRALDLPFVGGKGGRA